MSSGTRVAVRKKLLLSLLVPIFLVGWAVVPMSEAAFNSQVCLSNNGTFYFLLRDDGTVGDPHHVNAIGLGASTSGLTRSTISGTNTVPTPDQLNADVSMSPLFSAANVKHTGILSCTLPVSADCSKTANGGAGQWNVPGLGVIDGFTDPLLLHTLSGGGGGLPSGVAIGNRYAFSTGPTTIVNKGGALPSDGFDMSVGQCVVFVPTKLPALPDALRGTR